MNRADYTLLGIAVVASLLILVPIIASAEAQVVQNATIPFTYSNNGTTINQPAFINATGTWLISDYMENEWRPAPPPYVPSTTTSTSTSSSTPTSYVPYNPPQPPTPTIIYDDTDKYYLYDGFIKQLAERTTVGSNYILVEDFINEEATWTSTIEKIQDGFTVREDGTGVPTWKNYVLDQSGSKIIFNSNSIGGFVYDEPSCSYSIKENGFNGNTVIPSVSAVATGLVNGEWINLSVNNESCVVDVTSNTEGIVITSTKTGQSNPVMNTFTNGTSYITYNDSETFTQVLDVNVNSGIKETWKVWNTDDTQLGISQTVHTGPSIEIAGQVIDIQAVNGQSFDRQFIEANEAEILKLTDSVNYDFDEGINSLTGVNIIYDTDYKVNLDYASGNFVGYLEIDPTFVFATSDAGVIRNNPATTGTSCGWNTAYSYFMLEKPTTSQNDHCAIIYAEWDTSSIADGTVIDDVSIEYDVTSINTGWGAVEDWEINPMTYQPSVSTPLVIGTDAEDGTPYVSITASSTSVANNVVKDLGSSADTDLTNLLSSDWFAVGIGFDDYVRNSSHPTLVLNVPELKVTYKVPATAPSPPTNVVATSGMPIGISWTAPTNFGSDTDGNAYTSLGGYGVARTTSATSLTELPDNSGSNAGLDFTDNEFLLHGLDTIVGSTVTFAADYTSGSSWTQVGTHITITGGYAFHDDGGSAHDDYVHTPIGSTLSDDFVAEFEYYNFGSGAINLYPLVLAAGTGTVGTSNQDGIFVVESNPNMLQVRYKDGSNTATGSNTNSASMSSNTQYYNTLIRDGQVLTLTMYTDPERTLQHGSTMTSTIPSGTTISGLDTLHHSARSSGGGGTSGYDYKIRDVVIYDGITSIVQGGDSLEDKSTNSVPITYGTITSSSASTTITQTGTDDDSGIDWTTGGGTYGGGFGQTFQTGHVLIDKYITSVDVWLRYNGAQGNNPTQTISLWHTGSVASDLKSTSEITFESDTLTGSFVQKTFTFDNPVIVTADDALYFNIPADANTSGGWTVDIDGGGSTKANENFFTCPDCQGTYTDQTYRELRYSIDYVILSSVPSPPTSTTGIIGTALQDPNLIYTDSNLPDNTDTLSVGGFVKLDDTIGTRDSTYDGANNGATTGVTGKIGNAWDFDGSNDYVDLGSASKWMGKEDLSFSLWINFDSSQGGWAVPFQIGNAEDPRIALTFNYQGGGLMYYKMSEGSLSGGNGLAQGTAPVPAKGQWVHLVGVMDGSQADIQLYVDGSAVSTSVSGTPSHTPSNLAGDSYLGNHMYTNHSYWVDGMMDELIFYDIALTQSDVTALYNSGSGTATPDTNGMILHYDFEQTGTTLENQFITATLPPANTKLLGLNDVTFNVGTTSASVTSTTPITFEDDFSSYADTTAGDNAWVTTDTSINRVNPTDDDLDWKKSGTNRIYYDLGNVVSDSSFVLRAKMTIDTMTAGDATFIGLVMSADTNSGNTAGEWLGLSMTTAQPSPNHCCVFSAQSALSGVLSQGGQTDKVLDIATGTYYVEITRLTTTSYKVELFSDSSYSISLGSQTKTISSSLGSFQYIKIMNRHGMGGNLIGTIDDVKFYDGVTSASDSTIVSTGTDQTINPTTVGSILSTNTASGCATWLNSVTNTMHVDKEPLSDPNGRCRAPMMDFSLSGITEPITSATLTFDVTSDPNEDQDCHIINLPTQMSHSQTTFDEMYALDLASDASATCGTLANGQSISFNADGIADINANIAGSEGFYSLGLFYDSTTRDANDRYGSKTMTNPVLTLTSGLTDNRLTPQHYAFTRDSSNLWTIYQNGVSQATATDATSLGSNAGTSQTTTPTTSSFKATAQGNSSGNQCDTTGTAFQDTYSDKIQHATANSNSQCREYVYEWDTSSIPDNVLISDVSITYSNSYNVGGKVIDYQAITSVQPSTLSGASGATTIFGTSSTSTTYTSGVPTNAGTDTIDLGSSADSDLQSNLSNDWFAVILKYTGNLDSVYSYAALNDASLTVTYSSPSDYTTNISGSLDEFFINSDDLTTAEIASISARGIDAWAILANPNDYILAQTELPNNSIVEGVASIPYTGVNDWYRIQATGSATASGCNDSSTAKNQVSAKSYVDSIGNTCGVTVYDWDISSIPSGVTVTDVKLRMDVLSVGTPRDCSVVQITDNITSASASTLWTSATTGTEYVTNDSTCTTTGNDKVIDLGTTADSFLTSTTDSKFAIALRQTNMIPDSTEHMVMLTTYPVGVAPTTSVELEISYTEPNPTGEEIDFTDNEFLLHGLETIQGTVPDHNFDFSTTPTGWTEMDSARMGITGGQFHAKSLADGSNDSTYVPVGILGDDWSIRMKAESIGYQSGSSGGLLYIGLVEDTTSSGNGGYGNGQASLWVDSHTLGIFIGDRYGDRSNMGARVVEAGSIITGGTTWGSSSSYIDMADNGGTVYLEMKLEGGWSSGTFSATTYTDDTYSTVYGGGNNGANTNSITIGGSSPNNASTDLTYLVFKNPTSAATGYTTDYMEFNFDDIQVFIGNSSPSPTLENQLTDKSTNSVSLTYGSVTTTGTTTITETMASSTGWTYYGSGNDVSFTGGYLRVLDAQDNSAGQQAYMKPLPSTVSNTSWSLDYDCRITSGSGNGQPTYFGLWSDADQTTATGDSITGRCATNGVSGNAYISMDSHNDGTNVESGGYCGSISENVWYYVTLARTSATSASLTCYSDSARTSTVGSVITMTISSGVVDLDNLGVKASVHSTYNGEVRLDNANLVMEAELTTNSPPTSTTGTIGTALQNPSLIFADADLPDNTDTFSLGGFVKLDAITYGETVLDDLTSDKGNWIATQTGNGYDATNDLVNFKISSTPDSSSFAGGRVLVDMQDTDYIGSNISDDSFVIRAKVTFSALDRATGNENRNYFGFFSSSAWGGTAQDMIAVQHWSTTTSDTQWKLQAINGDTFEGSTKNNNVAGFTSTPVINTPYYFELTKSGGNVFTSTFTTNSDFTGGETETVTLAGLVDLQYFGFKSRGDGQGNGGNHQGTIDDIQIWNGVSSAPAPTLPTGKLLGLNDVTFNVGTTTASVDSLVTGNAWDFGGGMVTTSHQLIPTSGDWTYSTWVNFDDISGSSEQLMRSPSSASGFELGRDSSGLFVTQSGTNTFEAQSNLADDTWYNIVLVHSSSGDAIYLNGVAKTSSTISTIPTDTTWYLGGRSASYERLNGQMDQTAVWSVALTASQVASLYSSPATLPSNLLSHYDFEQTSGDLLDQVSSNDGTASGVVTQTTTGISSPSTIISATGLTDNTSTPQHYAVTRDSSNGWTIYQNGVSEATATDSTSLGANNAIDTTHDGTMVGTITTGTTGKIGDAWDFTTSDSVYVLIPSPSPNINDATTKWTMNIWVNLPSNPSHEAIITAGFGDGTCPDCNSGSDRIDFRYHQGNDDFGYVEYGDASAGSGSYDIVNGAYDTTTAGWYMVTYVRDGLDWTHYFNGVASGTHTATASTLPSDGMEWRIGQGGYTPESWTSDIDEMSFWSEALTQADITALYASTNGIAFTDLTFPEKSNIIAHYDFEQTGTTLENQGTSSSDYTTNLSGSLDEFFVNSDTLTAGEISDINARGSTVSSYTTTSTTLNDQTVVAGNEYYYKVYAINPANLYSVSSNVDSAQTVNPANAPAGVTATNGITQANVSWNASTDLGGGTTLAYKIYKNTNGGSYALLAQPAGTGTTYTDTAVTLGNTYGYKIVTVNEAGDSPQSNPATVIIGTTPDSPTLTLVTPIVGAQHTIDWTAPSNNGGFTVTGYEIERSTTGGSGFATIGQVGNVLTFTDPTTNLVLGDTYYYRILAINQQGTSGPSNEGSGLTGDKPDPVANVTADALVNYEININWTPANENFYAITGYEVFASENGATAISVGTTPQAQTQFLHQGLNSGSTYTYAIHATNSLGTSTISNTPNTIAGDIPGIPTNLTVAVVVPSQLDVAWGASSANGYTPTYTVAISTDSGNTWDETTHTGLTVLTLSQTSLVNGQTYQYKVSATNTLGTSAYTAGVSGTAGDVPSTPVGLSVAPISATELNFAWGIPNDNGYTITGYKVERSTDNFATSAIIDANYQSNVYLDTGLTASTTYYYRVSAINGLGTSPVSGISSGATFGVPDPVSTLALTTISTSQINLTWSQPALNGYPFVDYAIERSYDGTVWQPHAVTTNTTYQDTLNTNDNTEYHYRVITQNAYGLSAPGNAEVSYTTPTPPAALTTTVQSDVQIDLVWNNPTGTAHTGFLIEQSINSGTTWTTIITTTNQNLSYNAVGLTPLTDYQFRVSTVNQQLPQATGTSVPSPVATATTFGHPEVPTGLTATALPGSQIQLDWVTPTVVNGSPVTEYQIERSTDAGVTWGPLVANTGNLNVTYTDTGLTTTQEYHYRVSAYNIYGVGNPGNEASAIASDVPNQVTGLVATPTINYTIDLVWTTPNGNGYAVSGYLIERNISGAGWLTIGSTTTSTTTTYADINLSANIIYDYRVSAINIVGTGLASSIIGSNAGDVPNSPVLTLTALPGSTIQLDWTVPTNNGFSITTYAVEKSIDGTTWNPLTSINANTFQDTGLTNASTYYYKVSAVNQIGNSVFSSSVSIVAGDAPSQVTGLTATTTSNTSIDLAWTAPNANGYAVSGYMIERSIDMGATWSTLVADTQSLSVAYADTGLTTGTVYTYRVSGINALGTGPPSATAATHAGGVPDAPVLTLTALASNIIQLDWTTPAENGFGITTYQIEKSSDGGITWIALTSINANTFQDTGLTTSTSYQYKVLATNAIGNSAFSGAVAMIAGDAPSQVTGLTATTTTNTSIDLAWTTPNANGYAVTGYFIESSIDYGANWLPVVADTQSTSTVYAHTGLTTGQFYTYKISAINALGTGLASATAVTHAGDVPGIPVLTLTALPNSIIQLDWTAPVTNGFAITTYQVEKSDDGGITWNALTSLNSLTTQDTGLTNGDSYQYKVLATNTIGNSAFSGAVAMIAGDAPGALGMLTATTQSDTSISLTWTTPNANGYAITGYQIDQSPDGVAWTTIVTDTQNTAVSYTVTGLTDSTDYYFKVTGINVLGIGALGPIATAHTFGAPDPFIPLTFSSTATSATVNWTQPSDHGSPITSYRVEILNLVNGVGNGQWLTLTTTTPTTLTNTHLNLQTNTEYSYRIIATNPYGTSTSSIQPITTLATPPTLTASPSSGTTIDLTWSAVSGSVTYNVYSSSTNANFALEQAGITTTTYQDTALALGQTMYYKISVTNVGGESAQSASVTATTYTLPGIPTGLTMTNPTPITASFTWTAPTSSGGDPNISYTLQRSVGNSNSFQSYVSITTTSATDNSLTLGTQYYWRVNSVTSAGISGDSNTVNYVTPNLPTAPGSLTAALTGTTNSASVLNWVAPSNTSGYPVIGYQIERNDNSAGWVILVADTGNSGLVYTNTGLTEGVNYVYRVSAITSVGTGSASNTASVQPVLAVLSITGTATGGNSVTIIPTVTVTGTSSETIVQQALYRDNTRVDFKSINVPLATGAALLPVVDYPTQTSIFIMTITLDTGYVIQSQTNPPLSLTPLAPFTTGNISLSEDRTEYGTPAECAAAGGVGSLAWNADMLIGDPEHNQSSRCPLSFTESVLEFTVQPVGAEVIVTYQPQNLNENAIVKAFTATSAAVNETVPVDKEKDYYISIIVNPTFEYTKNADGTIALICDPNDIMCDPTDQDGDNTNGIQSQVPKGVPSEKTLKTFKSPEATAQLGIEPMGNLFGVNMVFIFVIAIAGIFTGRSAPMGVVFIVITMGIMAYLGYLDFGDDAMNTATWALLIISAILGIFLGKRWS